MSEKISLDSSDLNNEYPSVRIMNVCGKIFVCN